MRLLTASVLLTTDFVLCSLAGAQPALKLVPAASLSWFYDDNLFATREGAGDQMLWLSPSLELTYETPRAALFGFSSIDMQRSADHPDLNAVDARDHAMVDANLRSTPKLTLGFSGRYDRTRTAGELNFDTGILLARTPAHRGDLGPALRYQATERNTISAVYDWITEGFDNEANTTEHIARVGFTRRYSGRAGFTVTYLGRRVVDRFQTYMSNAGLLGWSHRLTPSMTLTLQGGPRNSARGGLAPEIVASLFRPTANRVAFAADYWRGESIVLGVHGPVEVQSTTGRLIWPATRKVDMGLNGGLFDSRTLLQGRMRVVHSEIGASRRFQSFVIGASYSADFQRGDVRTDLLSDQKIVRRVFLVSLTVAPRFSRAVNQPDPLRPVGEPSANKGVRR